MPLYGQSSGDFKETSARANLFYVVTRNTFGPLSPDAFTQNNPPVVTTQVSATLATVTKKGVLGGSVAFTRPDAGNGFIGGAAQISSAYSDAVKPLGIFLNDSLGNAFENTPGVASSRGPYVVGSGSLVGVNVYETMVQLGNGAGGPVQYNTGDRVYAGVNGLLTNVLADAYEYNVGGHGDVKWVTLMGIVRQAPDATSSWLVIELRV